MWFRRDLRLEDNTALFHALQSGLPVLPLFIFDKEILGKLEDTKDRRVHFIHEALQHMQEQVVKHGSTLVVQHGSPEQIWKALLKEYEIKAVYLNHDYEPYARKRDGAIEQLVLEAGASWHSYKDQVMLEKEEVVKEDGTPYTVFTPYSRKWRSVLERKRPEVVTSEKHVDSLWSHKEIALPTLQKLGFGASDGKWPARKVPADIIKSYHRTRDLPAEDGTSRLGVHLRFGTLSIRKLASVAEDLNDGYLTELIWREFYMMILWHFPHVVGHAFKEKYEHIAWRNNKAEFKKWCEGKTGFPIVDAGMRQLNETGYMHNRVRMIVASFLTKDLLIDWRWGEQYFAEKLLDFELASNNGGWQWAAGTGCDAAPYFRIFNPTSQQEKFDPEYEYVKQWVPEFGTEKYPGPMVDHKLARMRCLEVYKASIND